MLQKIGVLILFLMLQHSHCATWHFDEERTISKNNLLTTIPAFKKTFEISFEFKPNQFEEGLTNILHLTATNNNCCEVGDRVAGVWLKTTGGINPVKELVVCSYLVRTWNIGNSCFRWEYKFPVDQWLSVSVQQQRQGRVRSFGAKVNGKTIGLIRHMRQEWFKNIKVYISNPWNNSTGGKIRRLTIKGPTTLNPTSWIYKDETKPDLFGQKNDSSPDFIINGYQPSIENTVSPRSTTPVSSTAPVSSTESAPSITLVDKTAYQSEKNTFIECMSSIEVNNFRWKINRIPISNSYIEGIYECRKKSGYFQIQSSRSSILVICKIHFTKHEGPYTCGVDSPHGHFSKVMRLTIKAKPENPVLNTSSLFLQYNTWDIVKCSVHSNPMAEIAWTKRLTPIKDDIIRVISPQVGPHDRYLRTSYLNITWAHGAGEYKCEARNSRGRSSVTLSVKVGPKPPGLEEPLVITVEKDNGEGKDMVSLSVGCGLLVVVLCSVVVYRKCRRTLRFAPLLQPDEEFSLDPNQSIQEQAAKLPYNISWEFPRIDITLVRLVGTGYFGNVWESLAEGIGAFNPLDESDLSLKSKIANIYKRCPENDYFVKYFRKQLYPSSHSRAETVAVKYIKEYSTEKDYAALAAELKIMIHIGRHKNIVNLLGACSLKGPLWLILEFCPNGDLLKFLRNRNNLFHPQWVYEEDSPPESINLLDLTKMAIDVSEGMCFLSSNSIIHRDLAARNILVGKNLELKIADFGMARDVVSTKEEYQMESEDVLPIRWMSLEALQMGTFSTSSDVWAFGIVLYEMFTMGVRPYPGLSNQDIFNFLQKGKTMKIPLHCPKKIGDIMKQCWNIIPEDRPSFSQLSDSLCEIVRRVFAPDDNYYCTGHTDVDLPHSEKYTGAERVAIPSCTIEAISSATETDTDETKQTSTTAANSLNNSIEQDNAVGKRAIKRKRRLGSRSVRRQRDAEMITYQNEIIEV